MDIDRINVHQAALVRRDILRAADATKSMGGLRGRLLMQLLGGVPDGPQDDQAMMGLCIDLVNAGLLQTADLRHRTTERVALDTTAYSITALGTAVLAGAVRHPLVYDDRL